MDEAARSLFRCDGLPSSLQDELQQAQQALAAATDVDAACGRAAASLQRAAERRASLQWTCESEGGGAAPALEELAPNTFLLGQRELVELSPADGTAILLLSHAHADARARLIASLASAKRDAITPPWFDAWRAQRKVRAGRSALDLVFSSSRGKGDAEPLVYASLSDEDSATLSIRVHRADQRTALAAATLLSKLIPGYDLLPSFFAARCEPEALSGPRAERCYRAVHHAFAESTPRPGAILLEELLLEGFSSLCVEDPWSEATLRCLEQAQTDKEKNACGALMDYSSIPLCGSRPLAATLQLTPALLEATKLRPLRAATWREDCRPAEQALPEVLAVGPDGRDSTLTNVAASYESETGYWNLNPYAAVAHPDARWRKSKRLEYDVNRLNCLGALEAAAPDFEWTNSTGPCVASSKTPTVLRGSARREELTLSVSAKELRVCGAGASGDGACPPIALPAGVQRMSLSEDGALLALVIEQAGRTRVETWDVRAHRRLASFASSSARGLCLRALALGPSLLLGDVGCDGKELGTSARLVTLAGKPIAPIGGDLSLVVALDQPMPLGGPLWGFVAQRGDVLVIQDVVTGAVARRIPLGAPVAPDTFLASSDGATRFAIAYGAGPRAGTIAFGESSSDAAKIFEHSTCP